MLFVLLYYCFLLAILLFLLAVLVVAVVGYVLRASAAYTLGKNDGYQLAWLAWLPYMDLLVLMQLKRGAPFTILKDKWVVEDRFITGLIFGVGRYLLSLNSYLAFPVQIVSGHMEFLVMQEFLSRYSTDEKANRKTAMIIAILDCTLLGGLLRGIKLHQMKNRQALPTPAYSEN